MNVLNHFRLQLKNEVWIFNFNFQSERKLKIQNKVPLNLIFKETKAESNLFFFLKISLTSCPGVGKTVESKHTLSTPWIRFKYFMTIFIRVLLTFYCVDDSIFGVNNQEEKSLKFIPEIFLHLSKNWRAMIHFAFSCIYETICCFLYFMFMHEPFYPFLSTYCFRMMLYISSKEKAEL